MTGGDDAPTDHAEDLYENAPCGYVTTDPRWTITRVNRTFEEWTGFGRDELVGKRRFPELLSAGGRIYHETHFAPLLEMQGSVREIAIEIVRADGSRLPALVNSTIDRDAEGRPSQVRTTVFDATERRRYEEELLRARRREHEVAQSLQQSMLGGAAPESPELELGVVYRPGVSDLEIGGDWHDAFWLEPGRRVALIVGDVVGRGIEAAATMGQLRSAARALAPVGDGPAALLTALDDYAHRHGVGQMTTVACAELDLDTGRLRYACAGHPPPILVPPAADPRLLWGGRSMPLDSALDEVAQRSDEELNLPAGAVLLFYTDGLIERRAGSQEAMDRLLTEAAAHREQPAPELAETLVRALQDPEHADDVCLLVARVGAPA